MGLREGKKGLRGFWQAYLAVPSRGYTGVGWEEMPPAEMYALASAGGEE